MSFTDLNHVLPVAPSARYVWRTRHGVKVWFRPNRDELNEWHASLGERTEWVTADSEIGAEKLICERFGLTHWTGADWS